MNLLNGMKTHLLGAGTIGAFINSFFSGGSSLQTLAIGIIASLMVMALRHGISTSVAQIVDQIDVAAEAMAPAGVLKTVADMIDQSIKKALADFAAAPK